MNKIIVVLIILNNIISIEKAMSQINISDIIIGSYYTSENSVFIHPDNRNIKVVGGQENRLLLLTLSSTN